MASADLCDFEPYARSLAMRYRQVDPGKGDRQDVWLEAMVAAWLALDDWDGRGDCEGYVKLQMKRRVIDSVRVRSHGRLAPLPIEEWPAHGPDMTLDTVFERERLRTVVETVVALRPSQRARLIGRAEGRSNIEMAQADGCSVQAIDQALWQGRKAIKLALAA